MSLRVIHHHKKLVNILSTEGLSGVSLNRSKLTLTFIDGDTIEAFYSCRTNTWNIPGDKHRYVGFDISIDSNNMKDK